MQSVPTVNYPFVLTRFLLLLFTLLTYSVLFSQAGEQIVRKLSPILRQQQARIRGENTSSYFVSVNNPGRFRDHIDSINEVKLLYEYTPANIFVVQASLLVLYERILPLPEVLFIDAQRIPKEEVAVSNLDLSVNKVNLSHSRFPAYTANNLTVSVKENRPDTTDIDFKGRYTRVPFASPALSSHATAMATIIAGAGNTYYEGKGVATAATITSADFINLLPEPDAAYQQYNISVQNHSYGTGIENFYGADANAYDASTRIRPSLIHVFSAGNAGLQTSTIGWYAGIQGYATLTGSFKMGKNLLTVGHTDSLGNVLPASSKGPAYDGRVKPELVAYGLDGSSGAAAIVSGISLILQNACKELRGFLPSAALVKALLLNSADDVDAPGIDFKSGYGSVNAYRAMQQVVNGQFFENTVSAGNTDSHGLVIPPGIKKIKITLAWTDPPAQPNAPKALLNDLDLELVSLGNGQIWKPWVLNHFPHIDSLQQSATRKKDSLNNVEMITLDNPIPGNYSIDVKAYMLATAGTQAYAIAYQFDTLDRFTWFYPSRQDNHFSASPNLLRWESTLTATAGQLEYSLNNGNSWQLVDNAIDLGKGYYRWQAPDTVSTALFRMNTASGNFTSDTFTISERINVYIGFNCPDSFLLYWNKAPGVNSYLVYALGEKYMEPLRLVNDTSVVLSKAGHPSLYYAIAPVINNKTALRSYGYNYTTQGVECYIRSFLGSLLGQQAELELHLGTGYKIKKIIWEKQTPAGWINWGEVATITGLNFQFTDSRLSQGLNSYRVRIELEDGQLIYSEPVTLYFLGSNSMLVYPNPARQSQNINVLVADEAVGGILQVWNSTGQKVYQSIIQDTNNSIAQHYLPAGLYVLRLVMENGKSESVKLIVAGW